MEKTHELKILPKYFSEVYSGNKTFEVRKNDRNFKVGDMLILKEWDIENQKFTGNQVKRKITYILDNKIYLKKGFVILSLSN